MGRFYEADQSVTDLMNVLIYDEDRFPNLKAAKIIAVMDSKPKVDKFTDKITFAYIKTANEVERFLTKDGHNIEGIDYIMFVSEIVWELAIDKDKKRILSHELRHTFLDEKGNFKLVKHDIEDFYAEVRLNEDDPMWGQALGTIAIAKIEQMKEEAKANR